MKAPTSEPAPRRRRRTPEEAEAEIIAAAEALLRKRPFREVTVDEVMRRTDLSRPSFYVYFRDRHHLVLRVVEHIGGALFTMTDRWLSGEGDGPTRALAALQGIVAVYRDHGAVMSALADAATDDPDIERVYGDLIQSFIDLTADHIEREIANGHIRELNPRETAKALIWMNERYLNTNLGREQRVPGSVVVETLSTIWTRTLYHA